MHDYLLNYKKKIYPFHMPGHKLGRLAPLKDINLYDIDTTEVQGTDNLHHANGIIKEAQKRAKDLYGSKEAFFLVNGSTSGILAAISACCKQDTKILIARNCHKSVYNSIFINRLTPIYIYPEYIKHLNLLGGINPDKIEKSLMDNDDILCVVITSPTYEGFTSDIEAIAKIAHKYNKILIVDEAHGAHFKFNNSFPKSSLAAGADIVIHSLHKTLPAFTQSALLHVNSKLVNMDKIRKYLSIYQTSSPSYILMSGINSCLELIENHKEELFGDLITNINYFRNKAKDLSRLKILDKELSGKYCIKDIDISKNVIVGKKDYINGNQIDEILREKYNIQVEMSGLRSLTALTSIGDSKEGFDFLLDALKEIDVMKNYYTKNDYINTEKFDIINNTRIIFNPYEVSHMKSENIPLIESSNRICAEFVTLFPPGIPIIAPGEIITEDIIQNITNYIKSGLNVQKSTDKYILVLERGIL